mgnify:CR=1 FL=1
MTGVQTCALPIYDQILRVPSLQRAVGDRERTESRTGRLERPRGATAFRVQSGTDRDGDSCQAETMATSLSSPVAPSAATCPMCHTVDSSLTQDLLDAGSYWHCVRCGQLWDANRLSRVAAYAAWARQHDRVVEPSTGR